MPTKWYSLPLAVGALLIVIWYQKRAARTEPEVDVDEEGHKVIRLKGPWHVCTNPTFSPDWYPHLLQDHTLSTLPSQHDHV